MGASLGPQDEMDREEHHQHKKFNTTKSQMVKVEEPFPPACEDEGTEVQRLLAEPKAEHVSVDGVLCFDKESSGKCSGIGDFSFGFDCGPKRICGGLDSVYAQGQDEFKLGVLDGLLDEVDEVDDIYAADDISGACQDFLLDMELAEKISDLDCIPLGGSHVVNSSPESPGFSGSSNGTLVLSELSTATIPESECKKGSLQKTVVNKYDSPGNQCKDEASEHSRFPRSQDLENLDQFSNDIKCFANGASSDLYPKEVQATKISTLLRQKRLRRPTKRYAEEFFSPKSKQDKERHTVALAVSKDKHWKVGSGSELHHVRALTCPLKEKNFGSGTPELDPEDYEKLSDLRSRCLTKRKKASCLIERQQGSLSAPTGGHFKSRPSNEHHVRVLRSSLKEESLTIQTAPESRPRRGRPQKRVIVVGKQFLDIFSQSIIPHLELKIGTQSLWHFSWVTMLRNFNFFHHSISRSKDWSTLSLSLSFHNSNLFFFFIFLCTPQKVKNFGFGCVAAIQYLSLCSWYCRNFASLKCIFSLCVAHKNFPY